VAEEYAIVLLVMLAALHFHSYNCTTSPVADYVLPSCFRPIFLAAVFTSSVGPETVVTVALLCVWPIIIEATKSLNKGKPESVPVFPWAEPWNQQ
jgi:hypothetical protein